MHCVLPSSNFTGLHQPLASGNQNHRRVDVVRLANLVEAFHIRSRGVTIHVLEIQYASEESITSVTS